SDQAATGVLMWVPGSIAFLVPFFWVSVELLFDSEARRERKRIAARERRTAGPLPQLPIIYPAPTTVRPAFDAFGLPLLGLFLRWRFSRPVMQLLMTALAVVIIFDGLTGPQLSPMNLAGVVPWIHWRGLLILSLLVVGNVFCMACPFTLPRTFAARWLP